MDASPHLVIGAALTMRVRPLAAFGVGLVSHAVLDAIPHYNYTGWRSFSPILAMDVVVGVCFALAIVWMAPKPWGAAAGAAGSIFPEIERLLSGHPEDLLGRLPLRLPQSEIGLPWGLLTQIAVTVTGLAIAVRLRKRRAAAPALPGGGRAEG